MSRFYGFTYETIMSMDADIYTMYAQGMSEISNEELLLSFTSQSYTNLGKDDRRKLHKETHKAAFPESHKNPKNTVKLSDLAKVLN